MGTREKPSAVQGIWQEGSVRRDGLTVISEMLQRCGNVVFTSQFGSTERQSRTEASQLFFFFLTNLQQKYTFNNTYPSYVECTRNFILSYSGVFLRRAGEGGRERWLQCSHAVDFMTHTCQRMVRSLDKSSPEAEWVGP